MRVAAPVQRRLKDACPFKLLIFSRAYMCHMTAKEKQGSIAGVFKSRCRDWKESTANFEQVLKTRFGDDNTWWPRQELYNGEYSMIMFECVDQVDTKAHKLTEGVFQEFQNDFMAAYSHLPSVALQMYGQWRFMDQAMTIRDFVAQDGNQLLLLDSRNRESIAELYKKSVAKAKEAKSGGHPSATKGVAVENGSSDSDSLEDLLGLSHTDEANKTKENDLRWNLPADLERELKKEEVQPLWQAYEELKHFTSLLHTFDKLPPSEIFDPTDAPPEGPRMDQYDASALAFMKKKVLELHKNKIEYSEQNKMWLWEAIIRKGQQKDHEGLHNKGDEKKANSEGVQGVVHGSNTALQSEKDKNHKHLILASRLLLMYLGNEMQWEHRRRHAHCLAVIKKIESSATFKDLATNLREGSDGYIFLFHNNMALLDFIDNMSGKWFETIDHKKPTRRGTIEICVRSEVLDKEKQETSSDVGGAAKALADFLRSEQKKASEAFQKSESMLDFACDEEKLLAIYDLINSPYVHVGNLHDLKDIEHKLERMAITDRLPPENSMEALVLLRRAWTLVDMFKANGTYYKRIAKTAYALLLLIGIIIVCITVFSVNSRGTEREMDEEWTADVLLFVALFGSFLTGLVTMMDPTRKWLQLRGAQLGLESEIWLFRTRSGEYMSTTTISFGQNVEEHRAAEFFKKSMLLAYGKLQQSSGLADTSFFSMQTTTDDVEDIYTLESDTEDEKASLQSGIKKAVAVKITSTEKPALKAHRFPKHGADTGAPRTQTRIAWEHRSSKLKQMEKNIKFEHKQYNPNFMEALNNLRKDGKMRIDTAEDEAKKLCTPGKERPLENEDNFHSPVDSDSYITWRLVPALGYYHSQIPMYFRRRRMFQALILLSSIAVGIFAAIGWAEWTAIISSISGWRQASCWNLPDDVKFLALIHNVRGKLYSVYTNGIRPTDKLNAQIQNRLVLETEDLLTCEHAAWMSDAQQAAKMLKNANTGAKDTSKSGGGTADDAGVASPRDEADHRKKE